MLLAIAAVLCVGWVVLWIMLGQQVRRQSALAKKINALEARDQPPN
jgi:hypothetical protein